MVLATSHRLGMHPTKYISGTLSLDQVFSERTATINKRRLLHDMVPASLVVALLRSYVFSDFCGEPDIALPLYEIFYHSIADGGLLTCSLCCLSLEPLLSSTLTATFSIPLYDIDLEDYQFSTALR